MVVMDMPAGTSLGAMDDFASRVDRQIRSHREVKKTVLTSGGRNGEANEATIAVLMAPPGERKLSTTQMKEVIRSDLRAYPEAVSKVQDFAAIGTGGSQPLNLNLVGEDLEQLKLVSDSLIAHLKNSANLKDVDTNYRMGAPELQVELKKGQAEKYGISSLQVGQELRTLIAGATPAKYRKAANNTIFESALRKTREICGKHFQKYPYPT